MAAHALIPDAIRIGGWKTSFGDIHPLRETPEVSNTLTLTVRDLAAFPIILQYPSRKDWREEIQFQCLEIILCNEYVSDVPRLVDYLNQVLCMIRVKTVHLSVDEGIDFNGFEFVTGIKELLVGFHSHKQNKYPRIEALIPLTLIPDLEYLHVCLPIYYREGNSLRRDGSSRTSDYEFLVLEGNSSLKKLAIIRHHVVPEDQDYGCSRLLIRNCPALEEITVKGCDIDMDSSSARITLRWDSKFPEFLGVQPERFKIEHVHLQDLRRQKHRIRYLDLGCNGMSLTADDLALGDLVELSLRNTRQTSFDFLTEALHLHKLTIIGFLEIPVVVLDAFHRWNDTLELERRFQVEATEGYIICRR